MGQDMKYWMALLFAFSFVTRSFADTVTIKGGHKIDCVILQESDSAVIARVEYGTVTIPRYTIAEISKATAPPPATNASGKLRLPKWSTVIGKLSVQTWSLNLQQIPATVIDNGAMRAVPYQSYHCGMDYEVNIYGDPDAPAAIEIGVYRSLLKDDKAKANCIEFIASVLGDETDGKIVRVMRQDKDSVVRDGLTMEVTPPDAPDAYEGWWISIYDEKALDASRASDAEMKEITTPRTIVAAPIASAQTTPPKQQSIVPQSVLEGRDVATLHAAKLAADRAKQTSGSPGVDDSWSSTEMSRSRAPSSGSGGSVYVRGYYRKNGTYVHSYSRRR